jgi:hypothetical protein
MPVADLRMVPEAAPLGLLLTPADVAGQLGTSVRGVNRAIALRKLKSIAAPGGDPRALPDDVQAWARAGLPGLAATFDLNADEPHTMGDSFAFDLFEAMARQEIAGVFPKPSAVAEWAEANPGSNVWEVVIGPPARLIQKARGVAPIPRLKGESDILWFERWGRQLLRRELAYGMQITRDISMAHESLMDRIYSHGPDHFDRLWQTAWSQANQRQFFAREAFLTHDSPDQSQVRYTEVRRIVRGSEFLGVRSQNWWRELVA